MRTLMPAVSACLLLLLAPTIGMSQGTTPTITATIDIEAVTDSPVVDYSKKITKTEKTGRTTKETKTEERLFAGIVGGLGLVNLLMDGWQEAGTRTVNGTTYHVFTKQVEREVDEVEVAEIGTAHVAFTLSCKPQVDTEATAVR
jgi:hypothetical protein